MRTRDKTDLIVIHCSATDDSMDIGRKEIDEWHKAKGWEMIGYHFVIRRSGRIEDGRLQEQTGAHVEGYNSRSVGVCMVGGVEADDKNKARSNFTPAQWATLEALVRRLRADYSTAKIVGHRELNPHKACPSFNVQEWLFKIGLRTEPGLMETAPIATVSTSS